MKDCQQKLMLNTYIFHDFPVTLQITERNMGKIKKTP